MLWAGMGVGLGPGFQANSFLGRVFYNNGQQFLMHPVYVVDIIENHVFLFNFTTIGRCSD